MKGRNLKLIFTICSIVSFTLSSCHIQGIMKKIDHPVDYDKLVDELDRKLKAEFPGSKICFNRSKRMLYFGLCLDTIRKASRRFDLRIAKVPDTFRIENRYLLSWSENLSNSLLFHLGMSFHELYDIVTCIGPDKNGYYFLARFGVIAPKPENSSSWMGFLNDDRGYLEYCWKDIRLPNDFISAHVLDDIENTFLKY